MSTKQELIDEICSSLGIATYRVSSGSTEPKGFFSAVAFNLGLISDVESSMTKPELAREILSSFGFYWAPEYESTGGTITKECLKVLAELVRTLK